MKKTLLLISLLLLTSQVRSEIKWPQVNVSDAAISAGSGFALATMYDITMQIGMMDAKYDTSPHWKSAAWKVGIGALAGLVMDLRAADRANSEIYINNTYWGALGGACSVVIHF